MTCARRRRKCKNCSDLFWPDSRNVNKQEYCCTPECRKASKATSQARWLRKKENRDYFRNSENVQRVQEWRTQHPGYWRNRSKPDNALQDHSTGKTTIKQSANGELTRSALQDHLTAQHAVLVGLIAHLTGDTLQDDIVSTTRHMQQLGSDILGSLPLTLQGGDYGYKNPHTPADP